MYLQDGASFGQNYEAIKKTQQIIAFNSKFEKYNSITQQRGASDGYSFATKGNLPSDVVTCANLAYDVNRKNNYDVENHVEVIVKISDSEIYYLHPYETQPKGFFVTISNGKNVPNITDPSTDSRCIDFNIFLKRFSQIKIVNINDPNKSPNDYSSTNETIYEYYFDVDKDENNLNGKGFIYSEITGKVKKIVFTAVKTKKFDELGDGNWTNL